MRILTIKNPEDEKFLRSHQKETPINEENLKHLRILAKEMRKTMNKAIGIGLSANQVGLNYRFFVAQIPDENNNQKFYAIINPKITALSKHTNPIEEGCLSVPNTYGQTIRPSEITLEGHNLQGKKIKIKAWGLLARVFQHEVGHLDGKLFTDICKNPKQINANS